MSLKSRYAVGQAAVLMLLSCAMVVMAFKLRALNTEAHITPLLAGIETLSSNQDDLRIDLDKLINAELVSLARYQADQMELQQTLEKLDDQPNTDQARQTLQQELVALAAEVEQIKDQVAELQKAVDRQQAAVTRSSPRKASAPAPRLSKPPFTVIGYEMRGGEAFLAIAPADSQRLSQLVLLRQGDLWEGWRLVDLGSNQAQLAQPNGALQRVELQ